MNVRRLMSIPQLKMKIDTFDREVMLEWRINDAVYIDDKEIRTGPHPSYKKIKGKLHDRLRNYRGLVI